MLLPHSADGSEDLNQPLAGEDNSGGREAASHSNVTVFYGLVTSGVRHLLVNYVAVRARGISRSVVNQPDRNGRVAGTGDRGGSTAATPAAARVAPSAGARRDVENVSLHGVLGWELAADEDLQEPYNRHADRRRARASGTQGRAIVDGNGR